MKIEQLYTNCLAQGAYYIESDGEAAIIDPIREVDQYVKLAESRGAKIKYIFETHFHADFVSGHVDLSKLTGAPIIYGPTGMKTGFECIIGSDGQQFKLGSCTISLLHTPGHTTESSCYLFSDEDGKASAIFTGDTLFIGDVGRPDLAQHVVADLTQEKLAGMLFDSLRNKIMPLDDQIIVYPAHGAGSACGKNMSKETSDTLGHQKATNYALRADMTKDEFIKELLNGLTPPPGYFPKNVLMNINGYEDIDSVLAQASKSYTAEEVEAMQKDNSILLLDTRSADDFKTGFIPGSINIGLKGSFAVWAGTVIKDINQKIVLISDPGTANEAALRLARVGYDHCIGYLEGGISTWKDAGKTLDTIPSIDVDTLANLINADPHTPILDVRKNSEFETEHIVNAINAPLDYINGPEIKIDQAQTVYVHCAAGYRSMAYISILRKRGYTNLVDVNGGYGAIKKSGKFNTTQFVAPITML